MKRSLIALAGAAGLAFAFSAPASAQVFYAEWGSPWWGYAPVYGYSPYVAPRARVVVAPRYHRRVVRRHVVPHYAYWPGYHAYAPYPYASVGFGYHGRGVHIGFGW